MAPADTPPVLTGDPMNRGLAATTTTAVLLCASVALIGQPAYATSGTPGWASLGNIFTAGAPVLATDAAGEDFVAYAVEDSAYPNYVVYVAERQAGAGTILGSPIVVSNVGSGDNSLDPSIAADAAGDVMVAWYDDGNVEVATRAAGATSFTTPETVNDSRLVDPFVGSPILVAMNSAGNAMVAWAADADGTDQNSGDILLGAVRPVSGSFAGSTFGSPHTIYDPVNDPNNVVVLTRVAMGGGRAVIGYSANAIPLASTWSATAGAPSSTVNLGGASTCPGETVTEVYCGNLSVAVDNSGDATAAFTSSDQIPEDPDVGVTTLEVSTESGGAWSDPTALAAGPYGDGPTGPVIASMSPNGHGVLAWTESTGTNGSDATVQVATEGSAGGGYGSARTLDQPTAFPVSVGISDDGDVLATWTESLSISTLYSGTLAAGSTDWAGETQILDQTASTGTVVQHTAADGNTVLAFGAAVNNGYGGTAVQLVGYNVTGPTLSTFAVPGAAHTGAVVPMSVAVSDLSSVDPSGVSWDFGDGTPAATGFSTSHAFAQTGSYVVTATVTDEAGFVATAHSSVMVTSATKPPAKAHCVVPKLVGKTLPAAKSALSKAHCRLGTVKRPSHKRHQTLHVTKQSVAPHTKKPKGTKVNLTLAYPKR